MNEPRPVPNPLPDLWHQLQRLDTVAHVSMHTLYIHTGSESHAEWEMTARLKDRPGEPAIVVQDRSALRTVTAALAEAVRLGWLAERPSQR
ncbi:MAG: hypothetical protein WD749_09080 [Phycisphaerales bacterium]